MLKLLSRDGLAQIIDLVQAQYDADPGRLFSPAVQSFMAQRDQYLATVNRVIAFLQGKDSTLSHRIVSRAWLPEGPRFDALEHYMDDGSGDPVGWAFGALGQQDRAKHYATLYLNDLADVIRDAADPRFEFVRYAESLSGNQPTFDPLAEALAAAPPWSMTTLAELTRKAVWRRPPHGGAAVHALPGFGLCGLPHCPDHQGRVSAHHAGAGRRLCEHRVARAGRAARVRLL